MRIGDSRAPPPRSPLARKIDNAQSGSAEMQASQQEENPLSVILERTCDAIDGEMVSIREIVESLGPASFLSIQLIFAAAVTSPMSGIPFFSSFSGVIIALVAVQLLLGRRHVWLPDFIARREVSSETVRNVVRRARRPAAWLDRHQSRNLAFVTRPPFVLLPQTVCLICGVLMPILEIVPFSSSVLGAVVTVLAFGMLTRNGWLVLGALLAIAGALAAFSGFYR